MKKVVFVTTKREAEPRKRYVLEAWNGSRWFDTEYSYATRLMASRSAQDFVDMRFFTIVRVIDTKEKR